MRVTLIHHEARHVLVEAGLGKDLALSPPIYLEVQDVHVDPSQLGLFELIPGAEELRGVGVAAVHDGGDDLDVVLVAMLKHLHPRGVGLVLRVDDVQLKKRRRVAALGQEGSEEVFDAPSLHGHLQSGGEE